MSSQWRLSRLRCTYRSVCVVCVAMLDGSCAFPGQVALPEQELQVCGKSLSVELVTTPVQWFRGLSYRSQLAENHGMLFVFDEPRSLGFTSRHTFFSLTVAFLDENGTLAELQDLEAHGFKDTVIRSSQDYRFALEVPLGWFETNDIHIGCRFHGFEDWQASSPEPTH